MVDSDSLIGGGGVAALVMFGKYVYSLIRASMRNKQADVKRDAKYVDDCEERYSKLSQTVETMRTNYEKQTMAAFLEATRQIATAAEVQREGNIIAREQTRALDRVCHRLELSAEKSPPYGTSTKGTDHG